MNPYTATVIISGTIGVNPFSVRQSWAMKHGVWFSMNTPRELGEHLRKDAATVPYLEQECQRNRWKFRWDFETCVTCGVGLDGRLREIGQCTECLEKEVHA